MRSKYWFVCAFLRFKIVKNRKKQHAPNDLRQTLNTPYLTVKITLHKQSTHLQDQNFGLFAFAVVFRIQVYQKW